MKYKLKHRLLAALLAGAMCWSFLPSGLAEEIVMEEPTIVREATPETASDAAQGFIDAVNALDRDAIISASNAWGLASQAWQADPENEELAAALDEAIAAQDAATHPMYDVFDLYAELTEDEQNREDVQTAYTALCSLYTAMCSAMDNPIAPGTGTDAPPEDALSVLYGDLPDAPTGSYMGSAGLPIATGETKISISGWTEDLSASGYLNAEALNADNLTLTVGLEDGEDFAIVPILTQVEYPANNSSSYLTLPEDVTLLGYDFTPAENPAKLLEQTYTETSAAVSGIYVKSDHDFTVLFTYVAGDGTKLEKTLNVVVQEDADAIPTLYSTISSSTYSRPTPSVTSGKITSIQQVSGTWLIWFNGEDAYCCDNGKNGRPAGCPTYHYTHTSTVDATQYVPGDHYGNQMRIWGGLDQLSMGLLTVRESDDFSAEFCARNSSTYSASDAAVLEYAARIYNEQQLYIIEHYPNSQAALIYLSSARAAMGLSTGASTYDIAGYYTYIYDSGDSSWQRVALVGESFSEGEDEGGEEGPPPTYDANWSVDVTESASASFSASMTVKVDKTANITHEQLNDAEITVSGNPANGSLDGGIWSLTSSPQVIRTVNGDGSVTFTYQGSVTKSASRSASGSVTGKASQSEADSEAASQRAATESNLRSEARADAQNQANAIANAAARQARTFLVRETGIPHGFDATTSSEQGQTVQPNGSSTAVIYNQPWQCNVKWEKLDSITGGRLTEDTEFTFYEWNSNSNSYEVSPNYRVVRLAGGTYTVRCINPNYTDWQEGFVYYTQNNLGRFKIAETTAAYGYNYTPWTAEFTISRQNDTAHYHGSNADKNQPWGNKLIIHKTDSETGNPIAADAQFSLYEWNARRGLYEISTNYAIVRDADGSYTVKCLHTDWTQAQYGNLYFEDTLCDVREDTPNHDGTASAHPVYYTDYGMNNYPNSRGFTNDGQFLVVEHKAPSGYYGDWTDVQNPGTAGSDLGKRAYYIRLTGDGSTITLDNADYNADILTENAGGVLVETADGTVTVQISPTAKPAERTYITDPTGLAANEDSYTMQPRADLFQNDHIWGELVLDKVDLDSMHTLEDNANGNVTLEGAVYDLYCTEDIHHPDGVTGIVDYSRIVDGNGVPLHHTTVLTNGGWDDQYLPVLKKDHLTASAAIQNGKLAFANLYPGRYYLVERATGTVLDMDRNGKLCLNGQYPVLDRRLQPTGDTQPLAAANGEYTDYVYKNRYSAVAEGRALDGTKTFDGYYLSFAKGYLCDEVNHYHTIDYTDESSCLIRRDETSPDEVLKGGFSLQKLVSTTGQPSPAYKPQGAGFTVYRVWELSKAAQFTRNPDGSYHLQSILDAYRADSYNNDTLKYDFSHETQAIATMYESSTAAVTAYNRRLTASGDNADGSGRGWVSTGAVNEYLLSELFTNEEGVLRVQGLPYGSYLVVETTVPRDVFQCDPFLVTVDSSTPQSLFCTPNGSVTTASNSYLTYNILDEELEGYLQLVKLDAETGKAVRLANTAFRLYSIAPDGTETPVKMNDPASGNAWAKTDTFYTDANGELKTPEKLPLGRYRVVEIQGPVGYFNDTQYNVVFNLTSERVYQVSSGSADGMDDYVITENYINHETLGQITIRKQGEVLVGYENGQFKYSTEPLAGAAFAIYADGDIATPDHQGTLWYADGDLVATVITGEDGQIDSTAFAPTRTPATYDFLHVVHNGIKGEVTITLPLGSYRIVETQAPYGFVLSEQAYCVTLGWDNQNNDLVLAQSVTANEERTEYHIVNAKTATTQQKEEQVLVFTNDRVLPVVEQGRVGVGVYKLDRDTTDLTDESPFKDGLKTDAALLNGGSNREQIPETAVPVAGAVYELYTADAIYSVDGQLLASANTLLGTAATDAAGLAYFAVDVPIRGERYGQDNTANSGRYYLKEASVPAGYLLEQSVIPVEFTYENQLVAWQVVDCLHSDKQTTVEFSKLAFASADPDTTFALAGATLTVTDENGAVAAAWQSEETAHTIRGLHLDTVYTLTETRPADGYTTARSISFRLTQPRDGNGVYLQTNDVWVLKASQTQQISGSIVSPTAFADDEISIMDAIRTAIQRLLGVNAQEEAVVIANWVCDEDALIVTFTEQANARAIDKCLRESDFSGLSFTSVYLENGIAPHFFREMQVTEPPVLSAPAAPAWCKLDSQTIQMVDAPTRVRISKVDMTTHEEVPGATLRLADADGNVVEEWISGSEPHTFEAVLLAGETYTLTELLVPDASGFVQASSVQFTVQDDGKVQHIFMQDDHTRVLISKTDISTGREIPGAHLKLESAAGHPVAEWISDGEPHLIERLPVGSYRLTETLAPTELGYVRAESIAFEVAHTGDIQKVEMKDDYTKVDISKLDITDSHALPGAHLTVTKENGEQIAEWDSDGLPHRIERLAPGSYILTEETAPSGYKKAESIRFTVKETGEVQKVVMYNATLGTFTISKRDADSGYALSGAELSIRDAAGNVVQSWVSKDHDLALLVLGEATAARDPRRNILLLSTDSKEFVYTLTEDNAPDGYLVAAPMEFKLMELDNRLALFLRQDGAWVKQPEPTLVMLDERSPEYIPYKPFPQTGS